MFFAALRWLVHLLNGMRVANDQGRPESVRGAAQHTLPHATWRRLADEIRYRVRSPGQR